jgi:hypothetical protein
LRHFLDFIGQLDELSSSDGWHKAGMAEALQSLLPEKIM